MFQLREYLSKLDNKLLIPTAGPYVAEVINKYLSQVVGLSRLNFSYYAGKTYDSEGKIMFMILSSILRQGEG